jgi:hypothetical protein
MQDEDFFDTVDVLSQKDSQEAPISPRVSAKVARVTERVVGVVDLVKTTSLLQKRLIDLCSSVRTQIKKNEKDLADAEEARLDVNLDLDDIKDASTLDRQVNLEEHRRKVAASKRLRSALMFCLISCGEAKMLLQPSSDKGARQFIEEAQSRLASDAGGDVEKHEANVANAEAELFGQDSDEKKEKGPSGAGRSPKPAAFG